MTDGKQAFLDAKLFLRKLKRYLAKQIEISSGQQSFNYITIAEPQGESHGNSWHLHILLIFEDTAPFIENDTISLFLTPDNCIRQFEVVQERCRRDRSIGTKIVHEILTLSDEEALFFLQNENMMYEFAYRCAEIYVWDGFQCVYGIHYGFHEDNDEQKEKRKRLHIHFVINSVSYVTGNYFQSKLGSKAYSFDNEIFFKVPYGTKEREYMMHKMLYEEYLKIPNKYECQNFGEYIDTAYPQYPRNE